MASAPRPLRKDLAYCTFCPKMCRFACPVAEGERDESLTPTALMTRARALWEGGLPWQEEETEALWGCSGCFHCRTHCAHGIAVAPVLYRTRAEAVRRGAAPRFLEGLREAYRTGGNPFGNAPPGGPKGTGPAGGVLKFSGCAARARVGTGRGGTHAWDEPPGCCGLTALQAGLEEEFRSCVDRMKPFLSGCEKLIVADGACALLLRDHPAYALGGRVEPFAVHLARTAPPRSAPHPPLPAGARVAYHDPCALGRGLGVYDEPRAVLRRWGYEVVEMSWAREDASCCGAGGALPWTFPRAARTMARRRVEEARRTGAQALVTASPGCARWMRRSAPGFPLFDLVDLV